MYGLRPLEEKTKKGGSGRDAASSHIVPAT